MGRKVDRNIAGLGAAGVGRMAVVHGRARQEGRRKAEECMGGQ